MDVAVGVRRTGTGPGRAGPGSAGRSPRGAGRAGRRRGASRTCPGTGSGSPSRRRGRAGPRIVVSPKDWFSARVLVVADADQRELEESHDRGQDLLAREATPGEVGVAPCADRRQGLRECHHPVELRIVAAARASARGSDTASAPRIAPGGLDMAARDPGRSRRRSRRAGSPARGSGRASPGRGSSRHPGRGRRIRSRRAAG